jgi:hypothetical protein
MCCHHRCLLHHICASRVNNDDVHQSSEAISDDKDIHLSSNVVKEKVGGLPLNMCSILQNNNCDNILNCIMGYIVYKVLIRLCDSKTRTQELRTRTWDENMKSIFIMQTYANMNIKKTWQGYGARSCLRLMLNRLKEMRVLISIYTPLGTQFKKASKEVSMCASN